MITCNYTWGNKKVAHLRDVLDNNNLKHIKYEAVGANGDQHRTLQYIIDITEEEYLVLKLKDPNFSNHKL